MSAEVAKPAVAAETGTVEPTLAPTAVAAADKPAEPVEPVKIDVLVKPEGEAAALAEEKKEEKAEEKLVEKPVEKPVEPIYSGALGYKAPGLRNAFRFAKKYFWFSEEPVPVQGLSHYLRGEKAEVAHPTAAWSSQTGKGLLYFVKHADEKATPAGVLNLSEATELSKDGTVAFHFKLHGQKHTFEGQTLPERDGWFVAVEKAIEEGKATRETIVGSDSYKEELTKLGKPATLAATAAKESSTPKKSTDVTPKPAETEPAVAEASAPARAGSSSSSSSDEEKKRRKAKSKSRSVSRGKRASIFGSFLGKKEKPDEKKELKKEDAEVKKDELTKPEESFAPEASTVAPVIPLTTEEAPKPVEEPKPEETVVPVVAPTTEEKKVEEEKPRPTKRGSIFGSFFEKVKSPTTEKKESEVAPAPPAKEPEVAAEPPKIEEIPATTPIAPAAVTGIATEAPKTEEPKPAAATPNKEKSHFSFGKFLGGTKEKVKSPTTEKTPDAPKVEEPVKPEETPAVAPITPIAPVEPVVEAPKEEKVEEPTKPLEKREETLASKPKRGSIFGNIGGSVKKEKDGEEKPKGLKGLFRSASSAAKGKKPEKETATPAKVEETPEPKEKTEEPVKIEEKKEEPLAAPASAEPAIIGDVVPDAVAVGQAPKSTPQVSTTA